MSISVAPALTATSVSASRTARIVRPVGKAVATEAIPTPEPASAATAVADHVRVDAQRGDVRGFRILRVRPAGLGGQRADLAGGVRTLQRGQVHHRDGQVDRGELRGLLDRAGGQTGGALLHPDRIDPGQSVQEPPERRLVGGDVPQVRREGPEPGRR